MQIQIEEEEEQQQQQQQQEQQQQHTPGISCWDVANIFMGRRDDNMAMLHWDAKWRVSSMGEYQGNTVDGQNPAPPGMVKTL